MVPILLYDGDCGFCRRCAGFARRWVRPRARIEPWQSVNPEDLGVTVEQCVEAVQWVGGEPRSGGRAVAATLQAGVFPWPLIGSVLDAPVMRPAVDIAYRWVARHRHQLPGTACAS